MLSAFQNYILKQKLFKKEDKILLAVSGGLDSVVLAHLLHQTRYHFAFAHCNFMLRGKESDEDERFAEKLAQKMKVDFFTCKLDTEAYALKHKKSIQESARELRYTWFEELRKKHDFDYLVTAHHKDDSIETFFINLLRGSGIQGLKGIAAVNGGVRRPLLFATREEIVRYAKKEKIRYREDSSNASDDYLRNRIRHRLIPVFQELNPSYRNQVGLAIHNIKEEAEVLNRFMEQEREKLLHKDGEEHYLLLKELKGLDKPGLYLHYILRPFGFTSGVLEQLEEHIRKGPSPGKKFLSSGYVLNVERERWLIASRKTPENNKAVSIQAKKEAYKIPFPFQVNFLTRRELGSIPIISSIACLDKDKLEFPLVLRPWKTGDRFQPLGMKGSKLVSDYFTDLKISTAKKQKAWVLITGKEIVWLAGYRIDERYKVDQKTRNVLQICLG